MYWNIHKIPPVRDILLKNIKTLSPHIHNHDEWDRQLRVLISTLRDDLEYKYKDSFGMLFFKTRMWYDKIQLKHYLTVAPTNLFTRLCVEGLYIPHCLLNLMTGEQIEKFVVLHLCKLPTSFEDITIEVYDDEYRSARRA